MTYRLAGESLRIEYEAESDADTLCSLTNHSYFNLNGGGTAMAHTLALAAERYLETSPGCLPTGRVLPVAGTPFDFRAAKAVGRDIDTAAEQLRLVNGYDHHFCVDRGRSAPCGGAAGRQQRHRHDDGHHLSRCAAVYGQLAVPARRKEWGGI